MLPRSQRLSVEQFNQVMEKGRITHSPLFIVRSVTVPDDDTGVSAVAPQKIFKKATQRTKLRRQIYEAIQPIFDLIKPHTHAVVFAKNVTDKAEFESLEKEIKEIFVKAGLLK